MSKGIGALFLSPRVLHGFQGKFQCELTQPEPPSPNKKLDTPNDALSMKFCFGGPRVESFTASSLSFFI